MVNPILLGEGGGIEHGPPLHQFREPTPDSNNNDLFVKHCKITITSLHKGDSRIASVHLNKFIPWPRMRPLCGARVK